MRLSECVHVIYLSQMTTFFFYCYGAHRYLHSFPTRRSSDLVSILASGSSGNITLLETTQTRLLIDAGLGKRETRSEERRVGKECRSRRAPDREKKNNKGQT